MTEEEVKKDATAPAPSEGLGRTSYIHTVTEGYLPALYKDFGFDNLGDEDFTITVESYKNWLDSLTPIEVAPISESQQRMIGEWWDVPAIVDPDYVEKHKENEIKK